MNAGMQVLVRPCKGGTLLERENTRMSKGMHEGAVFERGNASVSKAMQGGALLERDNTRMSKGMHEGAVFERGNASVSKAM